MVRRVAGRWMLAGEQDFATRPLGRGARPQLRGAPRPSG